jgi:hypothetical protein
MNPFQNLRLNLMNKTIARMRFLFTTIFGIFLLQFATAATLTSASSGNWSVAATWVGGVVPTTADNVIIDNNHTVVLNVNATVINVKIGVSAKLTIQANLTTTSTISNSLQFAGNTGGAEAILEMVDNTPRTVIISGTVSMGTGAGTRGNINVNNANHILEIKLNLNCPVSGGLNMQMGTLKFTGTTNALFDNGVATAIVNILEIGDGSNTKQLSMNSTITGAIRFKDNGTITIKNTATFLLSGVAQLNAPAPSGANVSLNILNGGKLYSNTITTGTVNDVLQHIPLLNNGLLDNDVNAGQLYLYGLSTTASAFKVPVGKIGDLIFGRSGTTSGATVTVNMYGTGARTVKILGNVTASKNPSTTTSTTPYLFASGTASTSDAGASIWELAGGTSSSFKDFLYDRNGSITFGTITGSGTKPTEQPTLKISGFYNLQHNNNSASSTFRVHNIELSDNAQLLMGTNFSENNGTTGTEGSPHNFHLRGNISIGSNAVLDLSSYASITNIDPSTAATIGTVLWSGAGALKVYSLRGHFINSACIVSSSIANIYVRGNSTKATSPLPCSNFGNGSNTNFIMTSGNIIFENGVAGGPGFQESLLGTDKYSLHNVILENGVNLYFNHNNGASGYFKITGNLTLNGTATIGAYLNATGGGFLEFAGTANQVIGGGGGTGLLELRNVKMNNAAGITLQRDLHLTKKNSASSTAFLDFTNGLISTSASALLIVYPSFSPTNFSNSSYVSGPMRYFVQNTAHNASNQTNPVFITGKNSRLGRVGITNVTGIVNNDYFDAEYFTGTSADALGAGTTPVTTLANTHSYSPAVIKTSEREYWKIEKGSTSGTNLSTGKVTLYYEDNSFSKLADKGKDKLRVMHWTGSAWDDEGNDNTNATQASTASGSINSDQIISSFSPFTFGTTDLTLNPLPITLNNLRGEITGATNTVYWTTITENDNHKFVLQKSTNGNHFNAIGELLTKAINGNSNTALHYNYTDVNPVQGKQYYRLQMVDYGGRITYSPVVTVHRSASKLEIVEVRPNPTRDIFYFKLLGASSSVQITVRDLSGKPVMVQQLNTNHFSLNLTRFSNGLYIVEAIDRTTNEKAVVRVVKL